MGVESRQTVRMFHEYPLAQRIASADEIGVACAHNRTSGCRAHGCADRCAQVDAIVALAVVYLRVGAGKWRVAEVLSDADGVERPREARTTRGQARWIKRELELG